MTDFLVTQNNSSGLPASKDWQQESYSQTQLKVTVDATQDSPKEVNLRDALEWLLRNPEGDHEVHHGTEEERSRRKERKVDLLIWLMNLERRLSPYHEPA